MLKKTLLALITICSVVMGTLVFAEEIHWGNSLSEGLELANKNNKPIMVDFYTDWCGWCKKLDQDTYSNTKVQELATKFVCVKVDGDSDTSNVSKYGIDGYPTIVFLDSKGNEIDRNVGYAGPDELVNIMEKILK